MSDPYWDALPIVRQHPELLAQIATLKEGSELAAQKRLREQFPAGVVSAALTLAELRGRAREKFSRAHDMWFDRVSLEQSTSEIVARHKAARFSGSIVDLCSGIGGDTVALATRGNVRSIDLNPAILQCLLWNAAAYGVEAAVETSAEDVRHADLRGALVHLDPDRRTGGQRFLRLEQGSPPLDMLQQLTATHSGALKLSPASNFGGKFPNAEIELISVAGECKEATVWFGSLRSATAWRATVLPAGATLAGEPLEYRAELRPPLAYIYDPDPAVVRAGLVDMLAEQSGLFRLDPAEEYLTSDQLVHSPFATPFALRGSTSHQEKAVRAALVQQGCHAREIKSRHIPVDAQRLWRRWKDCGPAPATVIFAKCNTQSQALICDRVSR